MSTRQWYLDYLLSSLWPLARGRLVFGKPETRPAPFGRESLSSILDQGINAIHILKESGFRFSGSSIVELGIGRPPVVTLLLSFLHPRNLYIIDNNLLPDESAFFRSIKFLLEERGYIARQLSLDPEWIRETLERTAYMPVDEVMRRLGIKHQTLRDAPRLHLTDESVDLVFSKAVLEHLPPDTIRALLGEFKRVLRRDGKMLYDIDTADHWSRIDPSISSVNFLRFDERRWALFSLNPYYYQNRLRPFEYENLLEKAGFTIENRTAVIDPIALKQLDKIEVCEKYRAVEKRGLATAGLRIFCGKKEELQSREILGRALWNAGNRLRRREIRQMMPGVSSRGGGRRACVA